jgi:hypothetical protein
LHFIKNDELEAIERCIAILPHRETLWNTATKVVTVWAERLPLRPQAYAPKIVRKLLEKALLMFPDNTFLLDSFVKNEKYMKVDNRTDLFFRTQLLNRLVKFRTLTTQRKLN